MTTTLKDIRRFDCEQVEKLTAEEKTVLDSNNKITVEVVCSSYGIYGCNGRVWKWTKPDGSTKFIKTIGRGYWLYRLPW